MELDVEKLQLPDQPSKKQKAHLKKVLKTQVDAAISAVEKEDELEEGFLVPVKNILVVERLRDEVEDIKIELHVNKIELQVNKIELQVNKIELQEKDITIQEKDRIIKDLKDQLAKSKKKLFFTYNKASNLIAFT